MLKASKPVLKITGQIAEDIELEDQPDNHNEAQRMNPTGAK